MNEALKIVKDALDKVRDENEGVENIYTITEAAKCFIGLAYQSEHFGSSGSPHQYETLAEFHEKIAAPRQYSEKQWSLRQAAMWWERASGASLGHNRSARYEARAAECRKVAG